MHRIILRATHRKILLYLLAIQVDDIKRKEYIFMPKKLGDKGMAKLVEMDKRQEKILKMIVQGMKHEDIAKKMAIGISTLYRDLKAIKDKHGLIPDEILAEATTTLVNSQRRHFNKIDDALMEAFNDYHTYKHGKYLKRPPDFKSRTEADQGRFLQSQDEKLEWYLSIYSEIQVQYNYAFKRLISLFKAVGLYQPDIQVNTGDTDNSITVVFSEGMKDAPPGKKEREVN